MKKYIKIFLMFALTFLLAISFTSCSGGGSSGDSGGGAVVGYYKDADGDGYGDPSIPAPAGEQPVGYVNDNTDCDDSDPDINPGTFEIPNDGIDQNCSGFDASVFYADTDGDGYGDIYDYYKVDVQPAGYVSNSDDCDDTDNAIYPGADEIADDEIDQNCDGYDSVTFYLDADGDGYGDPEVSLVDIAPPEGYVYNSDDCNDADPDIRPGVDELCDDAVDNDCNTWIDEGCGGAMILVPGNYPTIQEAIDAAEPGNLILVNPGTYVENIDFLGKAITVISSSGAESTIIDGGGSGSVVTFRGGEGPDSILEGFTITNGSVGMGDGGGIYCYESSPTINDCIITKNEGDFGGGIYCGDSSAIFTNCSITENEGAWGGGIRCSYDTDAAFINCDIRNNTAYYGYGGGGINCYEAYPTLINCTIIGNLSDNNGGGMTFTDSLSIVTITNCTVSNNIADEGGGIELSWDGYATVVNTIFWGNSAATAGSEIYVEGGSSIDITYSDILGSYTGIGNIATNPLFVDAANGDYHLLTGSPCIDVGTPLGAPADDIDGDARPQGSGIDIGSDEYTQ